MSHTNLGYETEDGVEPPSFMLMKSMGDTIDAMTVTLCHMREEHYESIRRLKKEIESLRARILTLEASKDR